MKKIVYATIICFLSANIHAQTVGIGTTIPNSSAMLDVTSSNKGFLAPRMTAAGRIAIPNPAKGLMVYDSSNEAYYYYNGMAWKPIGSNQLNTDSNLNIGNQANPVLNYNISNSTYVSDTVGYLFDNGGAAGNYDNDRNDIFHITMNNSLGIVIEIFQMDTESPYDSLAIESNGQRYTYWGNQTDTIVFNDPGSEVLVFFTSNNINVAGGFGLKWKKIVLGNNPAAGYDNTQLTGWYYNEVKQYMRGGLNKNNNWHPDSSGLFSFAFGNHLKAKGYASAAIGLNNIASGDHSFTIGANSTASGYSSYAIGFANNARGDYSMSAGIGTTASGYSAISMGNTTSATGNHSTAIGVNLISKGYASTVIGMNNDSLLLIDQTVFTPTTPLFMIGNGNSAGPGQRSNAMVVQKDGNIGLGINNPDLNLVIKKDLRLDAEEANNGTKNNSLRFGTASTGEFIASKRTAGGNQYGLDFYTDNFRRLSISHTGTVQVMSDLTVQDGKGLIRSHDGTQQKKLVKIVTINTSFLPGETKSFPFTWPETFGAAPDAYVGAVASGSSGGWAEVIITVTADNTTGGTVYVYNPKTTTVSPNFNIKIIGIGTQ